MDNGIDLNDLPGARGRGRAGNGGPVKPRDVIHARVHRPEIRRIPNLPEAWNRPPRFASFLRSAGAYLGMVLKFTLLLTLGGAAVAAILFGGYLIIEAAVSWAVNAAAALVDWILAGLQSLARAAIEFVVGLIVGAVQFVVDAIVWVVVSIVEGVVDMVLFLIDSLIEFWVSVFTFVINGIVAIIKGILDVIFAVIEFILAVLIAALIVVAVAVLMALLSPILVPLALLYYAYISIF